jgi:peptidoglycan/LPS O-acetylase OafA/YrhL
MEFLSSAFSVAGDIGGAIFLGMLVWFFFEKNIERWRARRTSRSATLERVR